MRLYFQGSELPTYRNLINEMKVDSSSLSYLGLRKRTKFTNGWDVKRYFPEGHHLFVDSGCSVLNNSKEEKYTNDELREIASHYYSWIGVNLSSIELYSEFDTFQLGRGFIEAARDQVRDVAFDKFLPIWHAEEGLDVLNSLGERFGRVGVSQTSINGRDIVPILNRMVSRGIELHGLAMTKPDIMQAIPWTSVSSTSWTTPQRYGDTIVWSHNKLKRYPKSMKDQARKKERSAIITAGFDFNKIQADDPKELLRLSLWSWSQLVAKIDKTSTGVTAPMNFSDEAFSENDYDDVGTVPTKAPNRVPTATPRDPSQKQVIPFLGFTYETEKKKNTETGDYEEIERPMLQIRSESMRICDTCFLASKCPMFEENSTCAYDIPVQVETKEQMHSLMNTLVSMQTQRVLFMKMAEDAEGGYADPNLSSEIDRLGKLIEKKHNIEQEGFSLTISAKQQGQMSMVDRIFGDIGNTSSLHQLEAPKPVPDAFQELGFIDVEAVDITDYRTDSTN